MLKLFKNKNFRNWGIGVVIAGTLVWLGVSFFSANAGSATVSTEGTVVLLEVAEMIEASGSLEAQPFAALNWKTSGVVEKVNVKPGDQVKAGDVLLVLQPASTSASIVSAQADLVNAQQELEDLLNSKTNLAQAVIDLKEATEVYEKADQYLVYLQKDQKIPQTETRRVLINTPFGYQYEYRTKYSKGPAPQDWIVEAENDLLLKKSQLEDAQTEYDRLAAGPDSQAVIAAQAKVDAAQATVNSLSIIAPFDGEVLSVEQRAGDLVAADELSVNLADMAHLYVETQVDESDIATVKLGNQVEATLDALPGTVLTGQVTAINPVGELVSGLVKYTVRIDLEKVDDDVFLPLGATANVVIQIKDASATLAVPITAIQNDSNGEYVWVIQNDGSTSRVDIVGGSIVGELVAVTGDLKEGDRLQLLQPNSVNASGPFGGGN